MRSEAYQRALRFLQYRSFERMGAVAASIVSALLIVAFVALLGLFADLIVEKGRIVAPSESLQPWLRDNFSPQRVEALQLAINEGRGVGLASLAWRLHASDSWMAPLFTRQASLSSYAQRNGSYLTILLALTLLTSLLWSLFSLATQHWAARAVLEAGARLRRAVYHQSYRLGTLAFRALGTSEAIGVFTRHLESVTEGLHYWLTQHYRLPVQALLLFLFALVVESVASGGPPWLTLGLTVFILFLWLLGGQLAAYSRRQERRNALLAGEQLTLLQESLQVLRLVKTYLMEAFNQARMERQLSGYHETLLARYRDKSLTVHALVFIGMLAATLLLYAAGWNVLSGNLGAAATLTIIVAMAAACWPLYRYLDRQRLVRRAQQSADVVFQFLDRSGDVGQVVGAEFLKPLHKLLEFEQVTLDEPGTQRTLLRKVSFQLAAGQRIALVGDDELANHALVYLIPRFLDPKHGAIRIDGKDLRWITLESLRLQVALVLQHHYVFNDTVANNIGCGDESYTLPQIMEAAKVAHAHSFIQKLPRGYETVIGELGHSLTIGEQFRIAMARAILRDPALIIIEEPAQALDDESKAMLDDTYSRFLPERTTIFLPHRLSTIKSCDQILLLHKGKIEGVGPHRELISTSELYRHLQYLEFNVFAET